MLKKISVIALILILLACSERKTDAEEINERGLSTELPDGFHDFYDRFHTDSAFQLDRIVFPLSGQLITKDSMETIAVEKTYTKEGWKLHRPFAVDNGYNRSFTVLGNLVIEKIQDNMGLLTVERRWGQVDTTWSLIYYGMEEKSW